MSVIPFEKSFASHEKAKYWSNKNEVKPFQISKGTDKKYWFNCNICNHEFLKSPNGITTNNSWCAYCNSYKLCDNIECKNCFDKSFASHEKVKYLSTKNELPARQICKSSGKKYWFKCNICDHDFISIISNITKGQWCGYCSNKLLCENDDCKICFDKSFASHEKSKYWSDKNIEKPRQFGKGTHKKFWFNCDKCNHTFKTSLQIISMGCWCNFCSNDNLCENEECRICFDKSFASNEKSRYWSNKNAEKPRQVLKCSNQKYWFDCDKCNHSFSSLLSNISKTDGPRWCPYCSVPCKLLCDDENCSHCFNNSFASHEKSTYWSNKNTEKPRQVFKCSNQKYWFDCDKCTHTFDTSVAYITNGGNWCRYCPSQDFCLENCDECYSKSMASHEKSKFWSIKNKYKPREIMKGSRQKIIFNCNRCELDFETIPYTVVFLNSWCPHCINKTELKLHNQLLSIYPNIISQFKQEWCKKVNYLPFDFCIPEDKIIIELDGPQHFVQISNWSSPEQQFENDKFKEECANNNGYSIIRLLQEDVLNDTYDWIKELCDTIEELKNGDEVANVYLCKKDEYNHF
jgi:very-short-patch-repair endonuclease